MAVRLNGLTEYCPRCRAPLFRAVRENIDSSHPTVDKEHCWSLQCTACDKMFQVRKNNKQEKLMTLGGKSPCAVERITVIHDVGLGDVIRYEIQNENSTMSHFIICTAINRQNREIRAVKVVTDEDGEQSIKEKPYNIDFLLKKLAMVYRYKALDCCFLKETLERAKNTRFQDFYRKTTVKSKISQQFANWCKTDLRKPIPTKVVEGKSGFKWIFKGNKSHKEQRLQLRIKK